MKPKNKYHFLIGYIVIFLSLIACNDDKKPESENQNPITDMQYPTDTSAEVKSLDSVEENEFEKFAFIDAYAEDLAKVRTEEGKYGFIDKSRKIVIEPQYEDAKNYSNGFAAVKKDGKWGFINKKGEVKINFTFDNCGNFKEGLAVVEKTAKIGYIDTTGKMRVEFLYEWGGDFQEGRARIAKDKKWGFIDQKGKTVVLLHFEAARDFKGGLAAVWSKGKWGYVNLQGDTAINFQFDRAEDFNKDTDKFKAKVLQNGKEFFIDIAGNCIENCQ